VLWLNTPVTTASWRGMESTGRHVMSNMLAASGRLRSTLQKWCRVTGLLLTSGASILGCASPTSVDAEARVEESAELATSVEAPSPDDLRAVVRRKDKIVEVEVTSSESLDFGADSPVLVLGDRGFNRSRHPADGNMNVLVFILDAEEFDSLSPSAAVGLGQADSLAALSHSNHAERSRGLSVIRRGEVRDIRSVRGQGRAQLEVIK
jgi:hypothetical protein